MEPITRNEMLLDGQDLTPITRKEMFIKHIYDSSQEVPEPVTREEWFLNKAAEGGGGDITVESLSVTSNGTYSEEGKAYSPVTVAVEPPANSYQLKSITTPTSLATFEASAMPMPSLKVSVEAKQEGSGTPSPENVRPISGWDEAIVTDTDDVDNPTVTQTTTISLGQTVYGGEVDVVNGTSGNKVTYSVVDLGTLTWGEQGNPNTFQAIITDFATPSNDLMCEIYPVVDYAISGGNMPDKSIKSYGNSSGKYIIIKDSSYSTPSDLATGISGYKLRYPLATPTTLTTQPTPIKSLNGINNLSVDCGEILEGEYLKALGGE